jgi:hypothetical protein
VALGPRAGQVLRRLCSAASAQTTDPTHHLVRSGYKTALIQRWLAKRPRYHLHFTPKGASWVNLVERWFALLTEKQLRRGVHRSTRELETAIDRYLTVYNEAPKPFVWTKAADEILASVARFCHRISDSGH